MKRLILLLLSVLFFFETATNAQNLSVKSNTLYLLTTTPNVGVEYSFAPRWTVELEGGYNPFTLDGGKNMKLKHWLVSPEVRYWFCNSFQGHFVGINANFTQFNIGGLPLSILEESRMQGWAIGGGVTYGYAYPIARRWNIELTAGLGCWYTAYDEYESRKCGLFKQTVQKYALGLTSLGVSFVYMIK